MVLIMSSWCRVINLANLTILMHFLAQITSFVHLLNVILCSRCKYLLQSLSETQSFYSFFISFLSFSFFILLVCHYLSFSFCLLAISSYCIFFLSQFSSFHSSSSWYHTRLNQFIQGLCGWTEWVGCDSYHRSKSTFGANKIILHKA